MKNKPLIWEPKNDINKFVFKFITENPQPADLEILEEAVKAYIEMAAQSSGGYDATVKSKNHNLGIDFDATVLTILIECASLVLSGQLEKLKEIENEN